MAEADQSNRSGGNCIKIGLPGKSILRDYFQENGTSRRHFLLLRISFPGRPIFIQLPPDLRRERAVGALDHARPHLGRVPPPLPRAFRVRGVVDVAAISVDGRRQLRLRTGTGFSTFSFFTRADRKSQVRQCICSADS